MKKTLATLLACILAFSLFTGCGEQTAGKSDTGSAAGEQCGGNTGILAAGQYPRRTE